MKSDLTFRALIFRPLQSLSHKFCAVYPNEFSVASGHVEVLVFLYSSLEFRRGTASRPTTADADLLRATPLATAALVHYDVSKLHAILVAWHVTAPRSGKTLSSKHDVPGMRPRCGNAPVTRGWRIARTSELRRVRANCLLTGTRTHARRALIRGQKSGESSGPHIRYS